MQYLHHHQYLLPAEGMADDEFDDGRKFGDVDSYNNQCQSNISQCHNGDNNAAHFSNALYTTEDNKQRGYGNNPSYDGMVETERMFKSCTQRIALYGVEGEAKVIVMSMANTAPIHGCFNPFRI